MSDLIQLFVIQNAAITADVRDALRETKVEQRKSEVELATDKLVEEHLRQIDSDIRRNADRMSEFYKIFYMVENDIRVLLEETLTTAKGPEWWGEAVPQAVRENVKKNRDREANEGVAPRSDRMIDYTTFGELGEIINQNWDLFAGILGTSEKNRVLRVVNRLNHVRGPIAHCGLLSEEEIVRLKLTVRDWYNLMS